MNRIYREDVNVIWIGELENIVVLLLEYLGALNQYGKQTLNWITATTWYLHIDCDFLDDFKSIFVSLSLSLSHPLRKYLIGRRSLNANRLRSTFENFQWLFALNQEGGKCVFTIAQCICLVAKDYIECIWHTFDSENICNIVLCYE